MTRILFRVQVTLISLAFLVLLLPATIGGQAWYVMISGTSMEPAFETGDLAIVRSASTYDVGDVVAFHPPDTNALVIHRIIGGSAEEGFVVQGDNKSRPDIWHPRPDEIAGSLLFLVPKAGSALLYLRQPIILGGLAAAIAVTMFLLDDPAEARELRPRWRRRAGHEPAS